jgi:UDP-galactopyranose mutase
MFGSVFARAVADAGCRVLLVDQRDHIAGNCYTQEQHGVHVHKYGAHIFHTNDADVWQFVNRFATFNHYRHRLAVNHGGKLYSFPINLMTFSQVWGVTTPAEAAAKLAAVAGPKPNEAEANLESWIVSQIGRELYEIFVRGYTAKQWGRDPRELPASIIRRIPIRLTYNDCYFDDVYQGIPIGGYTRLFENMLDHPNIRYETGVNYFTHARELRTTAPRLVYTGKIDEFFDYRYGCLEYRSLRFEERQVPGDFQGAAVVNYTSADVPYTRILEHQHFDLRSGGPSVVTYEYPQAYDETRTPYYPIRDARNTQIYEQYRREAAGGDVLFGGRLGTYQYYDMHQVVAQALTLSRKELSLPEKAAAA